jgi:hypothetical protein
MFTTRLTHIVKSLLVVSCLLVAFQASAQADTLSIIGSSNSQSPITGSSGQISFVGQAFSNNFNVTATGQTFNFVFGQYQIGPGAGVGDSGCTDGPCVPITLTGALTTPVGALSFGGFYEEASGPGRELTVDWMTGSGGFNYATPEGGVVVFSVELVDFFAVNSGGVSILVNQMARITVTGFQPGGQVPEPATMMLLGSGLIGLFAARRRQKRA